MFAQSVGDYRSFATGNWSDNTKWEYYDGATWNASTDYPGQNVAVATQTVTIRDTHTITINETPTNPIINLVVGEGASGILAFDHFNSPVTPRTLNISNDLTIKSGATFRTQTSGTTTVNHIINLSGNLYNDGTLDFFSAGARKVTLNLTGSSDKNFTASSGSTDLYILNLDRLNATLNFNIDGTTFTSSNGSTTGFLIITKGIFKLNGNSANSNTVFSNTTIPAIGEFWLNNPNFTVTVTANNLTVNGILRVSNGALNVGTASNENAIVLNTGSTFQIENGTVNISRGISAAGQNITFKVNGGIINFPTYQNTSSTRASLHLSGSNNLEFTSGQINILNTNTTYNRDVILNGGDLINITGGQFTFGGSSTGISSTFVIDGNFPNISIYDHASYNHTVKINTTSYILDFGQKY